jgi:hypothetical protein
MKRSELEHVIGAAAAIAEDDEIVVIGSQAILGTFPDAPADLLVSNEANVFPKHHPERADLIDGSIGELSPFHETFGYYAQGVGPETATLPAGWEARLVPVRSPKTRGTTGWCLEVHDLALSKYVALREKADVYCRVLVRSGLVDRTTLESRLAGMNLDERVRAAVQGRINADFTAAGG